MKNTFCQPKANLKVMNTMSKVNRWLNLKGIAFLKWIPILKHFPIIRGLCDITHIEWNAQQETHFKSLVNGDNVVFITPNHPEFYTDWMLDKEVTSRIAPEVASWATHDIVNGMGKKMQAFWLSNNLIAQIPGAGSVAKTFSTEYALTGKGVLLHPEGKVHWQSDHIAPLFSGVVDMAYDALVKSEFKKKVYILPIIWKLSFNKDVNKELFKELQYIVKECQINIVLDENIEVAMCQVIKLLLNRDVMKFQLQLSDNPEMSIIDMIHQMKLQLATKSMSFCADNSVQIDDVNESTLKMMNKSIKAITENAKHESDSADSQTVQSNVLQIKKAHQALKRLCELDFTAYENKLFFTQENIAEILKKVRIQYCTKGILNVIHKFVPIPVSSRTAFIANVEEICLNDYLSADKVFSTTLEGDTIKKQLLVTLQERMQNTLDVLNSQIDKKHRFVHVTNPFKL